VCVYGGERNRTNRARFYFRFCGAHNGPVGFPYNDYYYHLSVRLFTMGRAAGFPRTFFSKEKIIVSEQRRTPRDKFGPARSPVNRFGPITFIINYVECVAAAAVHVSRSPTTRREFFFRDTGPPNVNVRPRADPSVSVPTKRRPGDTKRPYGKRATYPNSRGGVSPETFSLTLRRFRARDTATTWNKIRSVTYEYGGGAL